MFGLNNKGWGVGNLIAFICIFLVVLIGISVLAYNYGKQSSVENHDESNIHEMVDTN